MGKTVQTQEQVAGRDGEIPLLSEQGVKNIDAFEDHAAAHITNAFDETDDGKAIQRITVQLKRGKTGGRLSDEKIEDLAVDLYVKLCEKVRSGVDRPELEKTAAIFGEDPDALLERLA